MENKRGFTIIELMISIFILSIAIVGVFGAFSVVVVLTSDASSRLTGSYLAQEGVEIIRNIRDTNWLSTTATAPVNWDDNLSNCFPVNGNGCEVDYTSTVPVPYSGNPLKMDSADLASASSNPTASTSKRINGIV